MKIMQLVAPGGDLGDTAPHRKHLAHPLEETSSHVGGDFGKITLKRCIFWPFWPPYRKLWPLHRMISGAPLKSCKGYPLSDGPLLSVQTIHSPPQILIL